MASNYITIGISMMVFIFYIISLFILFDTRKKLDGHAKIAMSYFMVSLAVLIIRRLQQIFPDSQILNFMPYSGDIIALLFAISFSIACFYFHKAIMGAGGKGKGAQTSPKPFGIKILLWGLAILIAVNLLARFEVIQLVGFQSDLLSLITLLFVATEIGVKSYVKEGKKKLDFIGWFGMIIIAILFLTLITSWLGLTLPIVNILKQIIESALLVFVIIEIFR